MERELEAEAIRLTALIAAGEDWSHEYAKAPDQHAALVKNEATLQIRLLKFFKQLAQQAPNYINWYSYHGQSKLDYNVDVIVQNVPDDQWDKEFIKVSLEVVSRLVTAGSQAGEVIYNIPLGISSASANIQRLTTQQVAALVGKKILKDGSVVDNPKAEWNVTQTVRNDIVQSIKTSLALGEDIQDATKRVQRVIANPKRSEVIARTESVNAYQAGLSEFGRQSGAVGKEWLDVGAVDVCAEYAALGPMPIDYLYGGYLDGPTAHPNCRCGRRFIYAKEWATFGKN